MFTQTHKRVSDLDTDLDIVKNNSTSLERLNKLVTDLILVKWNVDKPLENEPFISDFKLFEENVNNSEISNNVRNLIVATYFIVDQCIDLYIIERLLIEDKYLQDSEIYNKSESLVMNMVFGCLKSLLNNYSKKLLNIVYKNTFNEKFKNECINRYSIKDNDRAFVESFLSFAKSPENTRFLDYLEILVKVVSGETTMQECINKISEMLTKFYRNEPYWEDYFNDDYMKQVGFVKPVTAPSKGLKISIITVTNIEGYAQKFLKENGNSLLENLLDTSNDLEQTKKETRIDVAKGLKNTYIDNYAKSKGLSYPVNDTVKQEIITEIKTKYNNLADAVESIKDKYTGLSIILDYATSDRLKNEKPLADKLKSLIDEQLFSEITSLFDNDKYKSYISYNDEVIGWIDSYKLEIELYLSSSERDQKLNNDAYKKYGKEYQSLITKAKEILNPEAQKPVGELQPVQQNMPAIVLPVQQNMPLVKISEQKQLVKLQEPGPIKTIVQPRQGLATQQIDKSKIEIIRLTELLPPSKDGYKIMNKVGAKDVYQYEKHVYEYLKVLQKSSIFSIFKQNVEFSSNLSREKILVNNVPVSNDEYMNSIIMDAGNILFRISKELELLTDLCNIIYKSSNAANDENARRKFYDNTLKAFRRLYAEYFTTFLPELEDLKTYLKNFDRVNNGKEMSKVQPINVIVPLSTFPTRAPVSKKNELFKTLIYRRNILNYVTTVGSFETKIYQKPESVRTGNTGLIRTISIGKKTRYVGCLPIKDDKCIPRSVDVIVDIRESEIPNEITVINVNARYMYQISRLLITGLVQNFAYGYFYSADNKFEVITSKSTGDLVSKKYIDNASIFITENLDDKETVTLDTWISRGRSVPEILSVYFQIFHALYVLYETLGLVYYNIQPSDVFIVPVYGCGYWRYIIDGLEYDVPNYGFMPLLYGYDSITTRKDTKTAKTKGMSLTHMKMQGFISLTSPVVENNILMTDLKQYRDIQDVFKIGTFDKLRNYILGFDWKRDIFYKFLFFADPLQTEKNIIDVIGSESISRDVTNYLNVTRDVKNIDLFGFSEFYDVDIYEYKHIDTTMYLNQYGFNSEGYNSIGYNKFGYNKDGYDINGYDEEGYDKEGYNKEGYNKKGYDINGFSRIGLNINGYDKDGYNINGYNKYGFDRTGYNILGINVSGFTTKGVDRYGYNKDGYDEKGYDVSGYDKNGFDVSGKNRLKFSQEGFNEKGIDVWGKSKTDYNNEGYDSQGYNKEGYNKEGYDRAGFNSEGYDKDGYDRLGYNKNGYSRTGAIKSSSTSGKVYFRK